MNNKVKILYLENAIGWGGAAICLKLIVEHLDKNKYYPVITTPHNDGNYPTYQDIAQWYHIPDRKRKAKNLIRNAKIASFLDYIFNKFPYIARLYSLAKKEGVDIIHLNNEPVCNMAGVLVAKILNIPCISHVRGPVAWNSITSRWLYRNVTCYITVAEWIKRDVMKMGVPDRMIKTIWDGRKLDEFEESFNMEDVRKSLELKDGELSVGMVGRLNPWKGHKVFIDAACIIEKRFPQCKLFIIGGSSETYREYENELKKLVCEKNIRNVVFTGQRDDIPNVMRSLDVIVHASVNPDPYPNVLLEGMAAGRPVIATNIGGPLEMIENYKTGILIQPNDPEVLADKICELLSDKNLRLSLGEHANKVAFERYDIENHVRQIEEIYERLLKR
jgi:glycosyltransferase involved in cell wall biosynthesis